MNDKIESRIAKEKELYNEGLKRDTYNKVLEHANNGPAANRKNEDLKQTMAIVENKNVLEIGSNAWSTWIDFKNHKPKKLTCINISETELNKGLEKAEELGLQDDISFKIMDAHNLDIESNSIDLVYGSGILHHLEFNKGVDEVYRVLKPGGTAVFWEPLRLNPVAKLIRLLTPKARTPDELPLGLQELRYVAKLYNVDNYFYQFFMVLAGVISNFIFSNPNNILTRVADRLDMFLSKLFPFMKPFYRYVLIKAQKPE